MGQSKKAPMNLPQSFTHTYFFVSASFGFALLWHYSNGASCESVMDCPNKFAENDPIEEMRGRSLLKEPLDYTKQAGRSDTPSAKESAVHDGQIAESPGHQEKNSKIIPKGSTSFKNLVDSGLPFVDQSLFIRSTIKVVAITRPRGFGKTINLSMLDLFLNINENSSSYFNNLKICTETDYCSTCLNKYPTIYLDLSELTGETYNSNTAHLKEVMAKLYLKHKYLQDSEVFKKDEFLKKDYEQVVSKRAGTVDTADAVEGLSEMLLKYHKKEPLILIDDFSTPLQTAFSFGFFENMTGLIMPMLKISLKSNQFYLKGVMLGNFRIPTGNVYGSFFSAWMHTVFDEEFSQHFGFTESETKELIEKYKLKSKSNLAGDLKKMYQGYNMGGVQLYNPYSVTHCLVNKGKLESYWAASAPNGELMNFFTQGVLPCVGAEILLSGVSITKKIRTNVIFDELKSDSSIFWTTMTQFGYLTKNYRTIRIAEKEFANLEIPNDEIRAAFGNVVQEVRKHYNLPFYSEVVKAFRYQNSTAIERYLKMYTQDVRKLFEYSGLDSQLNFKEFMEDVLKGLEIVFGPTVYKDIFISSDFMLMGPAKGTTNDYSFFVLKYGSANENLNEPDEAERKEILANLRLRLQKNKMHYRGLTIFWIKYVSEVFKVSIFK